MKKIALLLTFIHTILISMAIHAHSEPWTWLYTKKFSDKEKVENSMRPILLFSKNSTPLFNQLIFSWNAFKSDGFFSFQVQVRDAKTKQWHAWHKMMEWGNNTQQSYLHKGPSTEYYHVRLEVPPTQLADGVRIKITPYRGANLALIEAIAVNISNFGQFRPHDQLLFDTLPSLKISGVPQQSQMVLDHPRAEHMCSPTSCSMLISYLTKNPLNALDFALGVYDKGLDTFGSWPFNTAHAFECCQGTIFFHVARLNSFSDLYTKLQQNIPVIVSVRGDIKGAPREFKNGHLIVVIGWDQQHKKVICHDPAFSTNNDVLVSYDVTSFCKAWDRSYHLSYIAEPK